MNNLILCPKCGKQMIEWSYDIVLDTIPEDVELSGYGCKNCRTVVLDLDRSTFDHYHSFGETKPNEGQFQLLVDSGYFDG